MLLPLSESGSSSSELWCFPGISRWHPKRWIRKGGIYRPKIYKYISVPNPPYVITGRYTLFLVRCFTFFFTPFCFDTADFGLFLSIVFPPDHELFFCPTPLSCFSPGIKRLRSTRAYKCRVSFYGILDKFGANHLNKDKDALLMVADPYTLVMIRCVQFYLIRG